jgi:hypothetical protein
MKDSTTSVLGFNAPLSGVPTSLSECVEAAGGEQPLVDQYVGWVIAHKSNTTIRGAIVEALEKATDIKRAVKQVNRPTKSDPNRMVEEWDESEQTYSDRVRAQTKLPAEELWALIKDEVGVTEFKAVGEPRTGAGRVGKEDAKSAETLLASDLWKNAVELLTKQNPGLEIALGEDGKPTVETLANAIKVNRLNRDKEQKAALGLAA